MSYVLRSQNVEGLNWHNKVTLKKTFLFEEVQGFKNKTNCGQVWLILFEWHLMGLQLQLKASLLEKKLQLCGYVNRLRFDCFDVFFTIEGGIYTDIYTDMEWSVNHCEWCTIIEHKVCDHN